MPANSSDNSCREENRFLLAANSSPAYERDVRFHRPNAVKSLAAVISVGASGRTTFEIMKLPELRTGVHAPRPRQETL